MSCKIIYNERNEKINVEDKNGNPSTIFPQIMSNPHVTSFEEALEIYLNTYNVEQLNTKNNEQTGITELGESRGDRTRWNPSRGSQTLEGAPINTKRKNVTGADTELTFWAEEYARRNGIDYKRQSKYVEVDVDRAMRIAEAYDKMEHAPQDPTVREAYENLIEQTIAQYNILVEAGYQFYFFDETNDPYNGNPMAAMEELRNEKRMGSFATEAGFGTGNEGLDVSDNPMLADTGLEWGFGSIDGQKKRVLANDLFRAVHDAFGHGLEGAGFRARGEENAWQAHARLFTGSAVAAITSETRGQNSWLNFGKYGEQNRNAKVEDTIFAPQKTGLMPEWTWKEGFDEGVSNPIEQAIQRNNGNPLNLTPNGKPSILYKSYKDLGYSDLEAERLTAQVYSDSFLQFFGDWINDPQNASKVVDENGMPLVVYHSSNISNITEFKVFGEIETLSGEKLENYGSYWTPLNTYEGFKGGNYYKAFLNIKNPFTTEDQFYSAIITKDKKEGINNSNSDGVILNRFGLTKMDEIVVFNPNQIKSATENIGTFSTDSNDIRYSLSQKEPNLLYKANDKVFKTFSEALKSGAQTIEGGLNTVEGFKTFFSVDSNSNLNTLNGRINHLIKQNILTGESYISKKGEKVYKTVGHNAVRKMFSATAIDGFVKSILANGDVILRKLKNPAQIELKTKKGETEIVNRKDLDKMTFQEMQSKFEEPLTILANVEYQKAQSGKREIEQTQILPENELQERLLNLLQKFGIPTMAIEEYQKRYEIKNGQLPNASALTDLANLVVAFKDGVIQMEDLTEEVAHLIVASMPQEQKENLLRNIHRTKEWKQYSEQYREVYNDDAQLREEILGKVLANSLQERFAQRESETENTILEKLLEAIQNFFNRVAAYFRPQYQVELDQYTENVYDNLMADALELDTVRIKETGHTLFSLGETTSKALNLLKAQESKIRNRATREKLSKTEEELRNIQDDEIELEKTAITLGEIAKKQATFLKRAFDKNTKKGTLFTQEENAVFNTFKAQTRPTLEALRELLKKKNLAPEAVKTINEALATISELSGKISNHDSNVIDNIIDRMVERHSLSERQKKELKTILSATQKDTTTLHTYLGSLIHARNPLLNMAGSVIGDMNMNANIGALEKIKPFVNVLEKAGVNPSRLRELIRGNYLISEINYEEKETAEKDARRRAYNEVKNTQLSQEQFDALKDLELNPQESKQYREAYERISLAEFAEDMYVASHRQKLETIYQGISDEARQFHENDRRDRAEIRRRATDENGLVIYDENDAAEIEQLNKVRTQMMNPRDESGKLYAGLDEDSEGRLFQLPNTKLSPDAKMALDLHKIQEAMSGLYGNKELDAYNKVKGTSLTLDEFKSLKSLDLSATEQIEYNKLINQEFPPKFLEELNKLNTAEEKADFLFLNAYVGFPQDFWESTEQSLMDKLKENEQEDLIKEIREQQQIVSYILKANRMFNQPSQINVDGMSNKEKEAIKDATEKLQELYNKASKALNDKTVRVPNSEKETVTNEAFDADTQGLKGVVPLLEFISNHSTTKGKQSLRKLMSLYEGLSNGTITTIPDKYEGIIDLDNLKESVIGYAKTKLLPYYKRTEPTGFTDLVNEFKNGAITAEEFIASPLVEVKPNFSFYESVQSSHINPKWLENKKNNRPQVKEGVFADKEYISYFGIQNGQPTRNLDMWEARKAMLEIAKSSLADYGEDGRNIYMLPQVGKRGLRQAVDTIQDFSKRSWKESIRDLVQFREDEKEFGENGLRSPIIPKYYISKLTDQKDVTDDLLYSYALLAQQSSLYKARTEAFTEMFAIEEALKQQKFENKEATATNAYKMFQSYMDYNIFGKKENFQYNVEVGSVRVDLAKVARGIQSYAQKVSLTGVVVPLTSALQGSVVKRMESIIGERLNPIAEKEGNALYVKHAAGAAGEILGINSKSYLNVLMEYFGMSDVTGDRYQNSIYGKAVRGLTKWGSFTHSMSNFTINPRVMFSVLADNRYYGSAIYTFKQFQTLMKAQNKSDSEITAEWKALPSLHEDIEAKDGRIVFNTTSIFSIDKLGAGKEEYFDNYMKGVASRVKITLQEIDTQIPQEEKSIAARHGIANFFMLFRNWLWIASQKRFKSRQQVNLSTGISEEGSWATVGRIFKEFLGKRPDQVKFLEHIKNVYQGRNFDTTGFTQAEIDEKIAENLELQRRNLKRVIVDMVFANLLLTGSYLLSQYVDDDEDPTAALLFLDYMTYRVANEQISGTVALPRQYVDLIESPIAAIDRLYDMTDVFDLANFDTMESGTFAGETKSARWLYRNLPAVKEYHRLANIEDATKTYKFFNKKNEPWTLATYYLLKEE